MGPGGLWILLIDGRANLDEEEPKQEQNLPSIAAVTVYTLPYKQQKVKYMHQTFFAMPPTTLEKAISNNQLKGFPMMNKRHTQALTSFAGHAQRQDEKTQRRHEKYATRKER